MLKGRAKSPFSEYAYKNGADHQVKTVYYN